MVNDVLPEMVSACYLQWLLRSIGESVAASSRYRDSSQFHIIFYRRPGRPERLLDHPRGRSFLRFSVGELVRNLSKEMDAA